MNQSTQNEPNKKSNQFGCRKNVKNQSEPIIVQVSKETSTRDIANQIIEKYNENRSFRILNLSSLKVQFDKWNKNIPFAHPYYAVKCNADVRILKELASFGCNFDCASMGEIQAVLEITKDPKRIIFAHPCKIPYQLEYASRMGVERMTADSVEEMEKIHQLHKTAKVLIRLKADDSKSIFKPSKKFGATFEKAQEMFNFAKENNQQIIGVSFHVGCGCHSADAFDIIIADSIKVFEMGINLGFKMTVLNIGGGFPGLKSIYKADSFEAMAAVIRKSIETNFAHIKDLEVISEPGRYFANATCSIVTTIIGKKLVETSNQKEFVYFIDEGLYGAFNCLYINPEDPVKIQTLNTNLKEMSFTSLLCGPTSDERDVLGEYQLPELSIGDRLFVEYFGDYSFTSNQTFNSFEEAKIYQVEYI